MLCKVSYAVRLLPGSSSNLKVAFFNLKVAPKMFPGGMKCERLAKGGEQSGA